MKTTILIALLALGLTAVTAAPTGNESRIQVIKQNPKDVDLPQLVLAVELTLRSIKAAVDKADADFFALLEGNPLQPTVRLIIRDAEAEFQGIYEAAIVEALSGSPEDIPGIIKRTINAGSDLQSRMAGKILNAIWDESQEVYDPAYLLYLQLIADLWAAIDPLLDIV